MWLMVFGTTACCCCIYREGVRCDLWCLVLRLIAAVFIGRLWDVTYGVCYYGRDLKPYLLNFSRSTVWRPVRLVWQLLVCWPWRNRGGGIVGFIFNILAGLSGQLRATADLATGKYSPVGLAVERRLSGSTELPSERFKEEISVWLLLGIELRPPGHHPVSHHYIRGVQMDESHTLWGKLGNRYASIKQSGCFFVGRLLVSVLLVTADLSLLPSQNNLQIPSRSTSYASTKTNQPTKELTENWDVHRSV
jgi:hypothetical protein